MIKLVNFKAKILGLVALVGVVCCIGAFGISTVRAAQALPKGGDSFEAAVDIQPGSYTTSYAIGQNSYDYFKIPVKAGQVLEVKFTTPAGGDPYAGGAIFNPERERVQREVIIGSSSTSKTLTWAMSSEDAGTLYLRVGNEYDANSKSVSYIISIEDHFDAGSQTDAGGTFDKAMLTTPGEHKGYLSIDDNGTDLKDFFKIRVEKGATLTAKVTPSAEGKLKLTIYDSSREELKVEQSPNKGAILTVSLPIEKTNDFYIEIRDWWSNEPTTEYSLLISTEGGAAVDTGDTTTTDGNGTDTTTPAGSTTQGPNWTLIGGGALLLIAAVVLGAILLKKKSGSTSSPPTQPEQPSK